ncbi:antitoxin [Streptomyces sp. NPDC050658]|uniref:antitoxin n=1 Tax=unclassified Streptomyces TaxID=2593676 RepID=UPI003435FE40
MSAMDKLKQVLKDRKALAGQGIDKAGDFVDGKTKGKYSRQIDTVQKKIKDQLAGKQNKPPRK